MAASTGLGQRVVDARRRLGLTQESLARRLDVSKNTVARWETGFSLPDAANLVSVARELGVEARWLVSGDADRTGTEG